MSSPDSCFRCSKAEALLSPSGLCRECAATDATADPTPAESPAPELNSTGATVTDVPQVPPAEGPTATPPGSATGSAPADGFPVLPESPPGFALVHHLGKGGMGDVYLAREWPAGRDVALKFLKHPENPAAAQRFVTELQVLAELDHPNIVGVLASDFQRSTPFFTMARADGGSLADALQAGLPAPDEAVRIIRVIAGAVAAAHAKNIIHRDLKPNNVLLFGAPGEWHLLKVADFGLAKRLDDEDGFTYPGDMLGTPGYMAPEQVSRANGDNDYRTDVYGLGATLYNLLTGRAPFVGATKIDIVNQVLADAPERPRALRPEISLALEAIVLKCLAKDPAERYQSVAAFLTALDNYEQLGRDPGADEMTRWRRLLLWARRNRRGIGAAAAVVLVVAGAFALGGRWWPKPQTEQVPAPDPVAEARRALADGRAVELVPALGPPRFHRFWLEPNTLGDVPPPDQPCRFRAFRESMLELSPGLGVDRYEVTLELRHQHARLVPAPNVSDSLAFYFGHGAGKAQDGTPVHAMVVVSYKDYRSVPNPKNPNPPGSQQVYFGGLGYSEEKDRAPATPLIKNAALLFLPDPRPPGRWRPIRATITPEKVVVKWLDDNGTMADLANRSGTEVLALYRDTKKVLDQAHPGAADALPDWTPDMPFGVLSDRASVEIRNVKITPIQQAN